MGGARTVFLLRMAQASLGWRNGAPLSRMTDNVPLSRMGDGAPLVKDPYLRSIIR